MSVLCACWASENRLFLQLLSYEHILSPLILSVNNSILCGSVCKIFLDNSRKLTNPVSVELICGLVVDIPLVIYLLKSPFDVLEK